MPNIRPNLSKRLKNYMVVPRPERMMMGHPDGSLYADITNNPYTIWVTGTSGIPEKVIDRFVPPNYGTAVLVGYHLYDMPGRKQVLSLADIYPEADWMGPAVMSHALTHSFGGSDTDWILRERILYVVPVAGENKVSIYPDAKLLPDGTWWWATDPTIADYSSYIPTSGVLVCLIVLDIDGDIAYRTGTPAATRLELTAANFPTLSMGDSVFAGLYLTAGMLQSHHEPNNDDFIPTDQSGAYAGSTSGITSLTTDVVATGPGVAVATIQPGVVTNAKLADMTGPTVKGKETGTGAPEDLSMATLLSMGVGVFGGAIEVVNETPDGNITHFTFDNAAYDIWVVVNGVIQKPEDVTFITMDTEFDLSWAPEASDDVRIVRLVPVVTPPIPGTTLLDSKVASSDATLDFTGIITTDFDEYKIELIDIRPATNNVDFYIQFSTDNGSTFDTAAHYVINHYLQATTGNVAVVTTTTAIKLRNNGEISNAATASINGTLSLHNPLGSAYKHLVGNVGWQGAANYVNNLFHGIYIQATAIDAIRFMFSSGNIASGTIRIYGMKK